VGSLPVDVVRYVLQRFAERDLPAVLDALDHPCLDTPRVLRAVVYLSDGSLSMLQHYVAACAADVREVLMQAEFVREVGDQPLLLRDMSQPFDSDSNLGRDLFRRAARAGRKPGAVAPTEAELTALPPKVPAAPDHHRLLQGARFHLGAVLYVVADRQPYGEQVCCYRIDRGVTAVIRLPVTFVYEQLAEPVDMTVLEPAKLG